MARCAAADNVGGRLDVSQGRDDRVTRHTAGLANG